MSYKIESIDIFVRETPPDRMSFAIGKAAAGGAPKKRRPRGILLVRMVVADDRGHKSWGVSGDRPSFGWLDKRKKYAPEVKLARLLRLVDASRQAYQDHARFTSPFDQWYRCHKEVQRAGRNSDHTTLNSSFASALLERAMIDAVCRLHNVPIFEALKSGLLGFDPGRFFDRCKDMQMSDVLPRVPRTTFHIRHTIGLTDPLTASDLPPSERINDGEPETLDEYVKRDGLQYFKVKISGDTDADLQRLGRVWSVIQQAEIPTVTLDGNESYTDIDAFARFVERFEETHLGLFQHTAFIEQPLTRALTHDRSTKRTINQISRRKHLVIDEADGELNSFQSAHDIGYSGVSHKNCKGFFKSLLNCCLCRFFADNGDGTAFQTGEDLSNMPLVPLHQDFAALGLLGIRHCERNGHHYSLGLSHLTRHEKSLAKQQHRDLYTERDGEMFLDIQRGMVHCPSLRCAGFGVRFEPDWKQLTPIAQWKPAW